VPVPAMSTLNIHRVSGEVVLSKEFVPDDAVSEVKEAVCRVTGIPAGEQRLLWGCQELVDKSLLATYDLPENANITLLRIHPCVKLTEALEECTGTGLRVQLKRRDILQKIEAILSQGDLSMDSDSLRCLVDSFRRTSELYRGHYDHGYGSHVLPYIRMLKVAAAGSGDRSVMDALADHVGEPEARDWKDVTVKAFCAVASPDTPLEAITCLESCKEILEACQLLAEAKRREVSHWSNRARSL